MTSPEERLARALAQAQAQAFVTPEGKDRPMVPMSAQRKAVLSALIALVGGLAFGLENDNGLTALEVVSALSLALVAYAGVFGIRNEPSVR